MKEAARVGSGRPSVLFVCAFISSFAGRILPPFWAGLDKLSGEFQIIFETLKQTLAIVAQLSDVGRHCRTLLLRPLEHGYDIARACYRFPGALNQVVRHGSSVFSLETTDITLRDFLVLLIGCLGQLSTIQTHIFAGCRRAQARFVLQRSSADCRTTPGLDSS